MEGPVEGGGTPWGVHRGIIHVSFCNRETFLKVNSNVSVCVVGLSL